MHLCKKTLQYFTIVVMVTVLQASRTAAKPDGDAEGIDSDTT
ncbi:hypothetical protein N9K37_04820 [Pseudomonadales bacterium]|nr:hypothetical protein [Pseudomonadales bacterium]